MLNFWLTASVDGAAQLTGDCDEERCSSSSAAWRRPSTLWMEPSFILGRRHPGLNHSRSAAELAECLGQLDDMPRDFPGFPDPVTPTMVPTRFPSFGAHPIPYRSYLAWRSVLFNFWHSPSNVGKNRRFFGYPSTRGSHRNFARGILSQPQLGVHDPFQLPTARGMLFGMLCLRRM